MSEGAAERWSVIAEEWSSTWDALGAPVFDLIADQLGLSAAATLLDVGCGAGGLLAAARAHGLSCAGIDPATHMYELARSRLPDCDLRLGGLPDLPWPVGTFDVVVSINAVQFAPDLDGAADALARVCRPGGTVVIGQWADDVGNDLDLLEAAAARATGRPSVDGGPLRRAGGLDSWYRHRGLIDIHTELAATTWTCSSDDQLIRAVLPGQRSGPAERQAVIDAAAPFRTTDGYLLSNRLYVCFGRTPGGAPPPTSSGTTRGTYRSGDVAMLYLGETHSSAVRRSAASRA